MPDEIPASCAVHRNKNERDYDNGQYHVRDQNRKVKRPNDSLSQETCVAMVVVVSQIGNQETSRRYQGRNLTVTVRSNESVPNKTVSCYQEQKAGCVQKGVEVGQIGNVFRHLANSCYGA